MAPDQFAQAGGQDVVGQVADEHVAAQPAQWNGSDRSDQALPAQRAKGEVGASGGHGQQQPGKSGAAQQVGRLAQVDAPQDEVDAGQRDEDADAASSQAGRQAPPRAPRHAPRHARSSVREECARSLDRTVRDAFTGSVGFDSPACGCDAVSIDAAGSAGRPSGWRGRTRRFAGN